MAVAPQGERQQEHVRPLTDYALLSDCRTAALVDRAGRIDWLCLPRFDSPSVFGRLLDDEAGHWDLTPQAVKETRRRYLENSLVLETTHRTDGGTARVTEALAVGPNERGHQLAADVPHAILRSVEGIEGKTTFTMELAARPEYGIVHPLVVDSEDGVHVQGGATVLALSSPVDLEIDDGTARARFTVEKGQKVAFALQHAPTTKGAPDHWQQQEIHDRIKETRQAWQSWSDEHQAYKGPWSDLVKVSGCVLQGLTFVPTGAMVAAPTTSLPEHVGGARNWDYRYCWVRDASFTLHALWVAACPDEAEEFFSFLAHAALTPVRTGQGLQIMFGIGGEHDLTEREIPHLAGWNGSRPVRIGNAAWQQNQLDIHGELLDAAYRLREQLDKIPKVTRRFLATVADAAAERWEEEDHGLWELRGKPDHYVYSKLMCWVALDRAIGLADLLEADDKVSGWEEARDTIRDAILEKGWSDEAGAFTQTFGGSDLDASALVIPLVGFLPPEDERVQKTLEAIRDRLTDERGLVYRYRAPDGLPGREGSFLLCTFWLTEALARAGRVEDAKETFDAAVSYVNDVGLLSEEIDAQDRLIGNFPQAFSHVGLINAAWAIAQAERAEEKGKEEAIKG